MYIYVQVRQHVRFQISNNHGLFTFFQQYEFVKAKIPSETEKKVEFSRKLRKYNISLSQYDTAFKQKEIRP